MSIDPDIIHGEMMKAAKAILSSRAPNADLARQLARYFVELDEHLKAGEDPPVAWCVDEDEEESDEETEDADHEDTDDNTDGDADADLDDIIGDDC